jgi:hypothetical protein
MSTFLTSENLSTYLLRELIKYTSEYGFPESYQTGENENLYATIRNIILASTKDPTRRSTRNLLDDLVNLPMTTEDLNDIYTEVFTGPTVNNPTVRKQLIMYLLLKELHPEYLIPENLSGYLELFNS